MTVVLELDPKIEDALKKKALKTGSPVDAYVKNLIERDVEQTYEDVMAPLWREFEESGMTEEELDTLVEKERQAVWEEKHGK